MIFSAAWAFRVYLRLSGCGMPSFFLVQHFSILGLSIYSILMGYSKMVFFSAVWAFCVYSYLSGWEMP